MKIYKNKVWVGLIVAVLLVCVACLYWIERGRLHGVATADELEAMKEQGNEFLSRDLPDSAMACYGQVAGMYDKRMSKEQQAVCAKAYNNMGYVCFYYYNDYVGAYNYYLRGLMLAENADSPAETFYLNIGNIYDNYAIGDQSLECYRKAFYMARDNKDWSIYQISAAHIVNTALLQDIPIEEELQTYAQTEAEPSDLIAYTRHLYEGYQCYVKKDYDSAVSQFTTAMDSVDTQNTPERYMAEAGFMKACVYERQRRYRQALDVCHSLRTLMESRPADDVLCSVYESMADIYLKAGLHDSARWARYHYYEIEDTLLNAAKYGRIRDLRSMYDMQRKDSEMQELKTQGRIRLAVLWAAFVASLVVIGMLVWLYRKGVRQRQLMEDLYRRNMEVIKPCPKAKVSPNPDEGLHIYNKVETVLATNDEIYQPDFTAERLALLTGYKPRQVSQAIAEVGGKNFNQLLGEYRVREACCRLSDQEHYGHLTIEGVARSVGFKSRTNFSAIFKRVTGLTPSEFMMMAKEVE